MLEISWYFCIASMSSFNYKKATQALNILAVKAGGSIDVLKAIKLIWLADRVHLRRYGRMITNDEYFAMKLGPVASFTYNLIKQEEAFTPPEYLEYSSQYLLPKDVKHYTYSSANTPDEKVFSKTDLRVLDEVFNQFSNMTKWQLSDYSHLFDEWLRHKDSLSVNPSGRFSINVEDFFNETHLGDGVFNQSKEALECIKELYKEDHAL